MRVKLFLIFFACVFFFWMGDASAKTAGDSPGQIWQVGARHWDEIEERYYSEWVEKTISEDFFIHYDIPVDCADVPYAIRWIYARISHLPAAVTTRDGHLFGHWSTTWAHLPTNRHWYQDQRFRRALLYILSETSSRTLPKDTYPIGISRDTLLAGTVFIGDGHAGIVGSIVRDGSMYSPVQTWEATLPRKVTKLRQRSYFATWTDKIAGTGLVMFRWPIYSSGRWMYLERVKQPLYSNEQYHTNFCHIGEFFDEAVARRIDPGPYEPTKRVDLILRSIYQYLNERVSVVREGFRHCHPGKCTEGSYLWEIYSTPSRDDMIAYEIEHLHKIIRANGLDEDVINKEMNKMIIHIDDRLTVSLKYVVQNYHWLSHNPADSIEARWGLKKCNRIHAKMKLSLAAMDFVEQKYRAADPDYADQGRRSHLMDLRWLQQEVVRAGCKDQLLPGSEKILRMIY